MGLAFKLSGNFTVSNYSRFNQKISNNQKMNIVFQRNREDDNLRYDKEIGNTK